jgi:hypothetical protein
MREEVPPMSENHKATTTVFNPGDIEVPKRRLGAAWREHVYSRILDLDTELDRIQPKPDDPAEAEWRDAKRRLRAAAGIICKRPTPWGAWTGVDVERAWVTVHAVEVTILRLSDPATVAAKLADIIADAQAVLRPNDPRLTSLQSYASAQNLDEKAVEAIAQNVTAVHSATANEHVRARSFRNILLATTFALTVFAGGLGLLGSLSPRSVNLCAPQVPGAQIQPASQTQITCPTAGPASSGGDVFFVELMGLLGASVIGAIAIRKMRGTSTPYAVPMSSLLVKLPTGAMTAVGALILLRAGVLGPAVAASGTPQVLAYALVFGASQQTFTRLIDQQAQTVLDSIPSTDRDPAAGTGSDRDDAPQTE